MRVLLPFVVLFSSALAYAGTDGSISGSVQDPDGVMVPNVKVQLLTTDGKFIRESSSPTGDFEFFPLQFGDYQVTANVEGFATYNALVHVASGANTQIIINLQPPSVGKEITVNVTAKRHLVQTSNASSSIEITQEDIAKKPLGDAVSLPALLTSSTPGVVQGSFGQMFFRGNHANIQYQIDGVQLPDSPSNTFGEAFSPRNIDHMEVITGGIPAEYGERLAAVINIVTRSGHENPGGEAEINYGSYNTFKPFALYGGSNEDGSVHYFFSAGYNQSDRGLDTPQPSFDSSGNVNQNQGGSDAVHDSTNGNSQFARVDWYPENVDKYSVIAFNSYNFFQFPNYPSTFNPNTTTLNGQPFFGSNLVDNFGNTNTGIAGVNPSPVFNYVPYYTNDNQGEVNSYLELVWKHTFTEHSFLQIAPYYKYSWVQVNNDQNNDLSTAILPVGAGGITGATPSSFAENRHVNNLGLKTDFTDRLNDRNQFKTGFQVQGSQAAGFIYVATQTQGASLLTSSDYTPTNFYFESLYAQDDFTIAKPLILNAGVRLDATQTSYGVGPQTSNDGLIEPRIGLNYLVAENTKLHIFYGKLFQPAPAENLRDTFDGVQASQSCPAGQICSQNILAEKDDYYEAGVAQQIWQQVLNLNVYYKSATNMLDDTELLNTPIAQPYNYANGFAYGVEFTVQGKLNEDWTDFFNYSWEIAMGQGNSGGYFADINPPAPDWWVYLDHVQKSTANAGVTYAKNHFWWTLQGLYGSGLRTGPFNESSLPQHLSFDTTVGYEFTGKDFWSKWKTSVDLLNFTNNAYPITIANGFNGSHYAPGFEFLAHLSKEL